MPTLFRICLSALLLIATAVRADVTLTELGRWPGYTRGETYQLALDGNTAWLASGTGGLVALDIQDPRHPQLRSRTPINAFDVVPVDHWLYVASASLGLEVLDAQNPSSPQTLGRVEGIPYAIDVDTGFDRTNRVALVACGSEGVRLVSLREPSLPKVVGEFFSEGFVNVVAVLPGFRQFTACVGIYSGGFKIIQLQGTQLVEIATIATDDSVQAIHFVDTRAFVAADAAGLLIYDLANPRAPQLLGKYDSDGYPYGVTVSGDQAYISSYFYTEIVNLADPSNPRLEFQRYTGSLGGSFSVQWRDGLIYTAAGAGGLVVLDPAAGVDAEPVSWYETGGSSEGFSVADGYAYVAEYDVGFRILDVHNPREIVQVSRFFDGNQSFDVQVQSSYAFVAAGGYGLQVVDISDLQHPTEVARVFGDRAVDLVLDGTRAYVANGWGGVMIVDISEPTAPGLLGENPSEDFTYSVASNGHFVYQADGGGGLKVIDIADPGHPALIRTVRPEGIDPASSSFEGLALRGERLFAVDYSAGLFLVFDLHEPGNPVELGRLEGVYASSISLQGDRAWVGRWSIEAIDISDPSHPVRETISPTTLPGSAAMVSGGVLFVSASEDGLVAFDLGNNAAPRSTRLPRDFVTDEILFESIADTRPTNPDRRSLPAVASLTFAGQTDFAAGTIIHSGPAYLVPGTLYPTIQFETQRQLALLHPGRNSQGAAIGVPINKSGHYLVRGGFARANNARLAGNGVSVAIMRNLDSTNLLFSADISADHAVNADLPFSGTGTARFAFSADLEAGDVVRFAVFSGARGQDIDFDVTAVEALVVLAEEAGPELADVPPFIVRDPTGGTANAGFSLLGMSVEAFGAGPLRFQWYRDGNELLNQTAAVLNFGPLTSGDEGMYTVEVRNAFGRVVSAGAPLRVRTAPSITSAPRGETVRVGESVRFAVRASGTEPLVYDWLLNGASLGAANLPELVRSNLGSGQGGEIAVRISNPAGTVTSAGVPLRVLDPVRFVKPLPALRVVALGSELRFTAEVEGTPPFQFQWRLNGQDILDATNDVYVVPGFGVEHAGVYTVVAVNEAGAETSNLGEVRAELLEAPGNDTFAFATDLGSLPERVTGANSVATREANEPQHAGQPGHRSVWYRWQNPAPGQLRLRTLGSGFDTLLAVYTGNVVGALNEVASNDDLSNGGFFSSEVVVSTDPSESYSIAIDGLGEASGNYVLSWEFTPNALPVPRVTEQPQSQTQRLGGPVELRVAAQDSERIEWEFNGRPLVGAEGARLAFPAIEPQQVGTYVALVYGKGGLVYSHPAVVEIGPQPGARSYDKPEEAVGLGVGAAARIERQAEARSPLVVSPGQPPRQWVDNSVNTTQVSERNHCGRLFHRTGVLHLQPSENGSMVIRATNTVVPVLMALYAYPNLGATVACGETLELVYTNALAGKQYLLVFGSAEKEGGRIELVCTAGTPIPKPTEETEAQLIGVVPGNSSTLSGPAIVGLVPEPKYQWYRDGKLIPGAESRELVVSDFGQALAGAYSVVLDNDISREEFPIATLEADMPLGPSPEDWDGLKQGVLRLRGNAGQRIAVAIGHPFTFGRGYEQEEELWLPVGGKEYRDQRFGSETDWYVGYREVPLHVEEESPLSDGRRSWRVRGGRLGRDYLLERSLDGSNWAEVRTNRVEEGAFMHLESPTSSPNVQIRARPVH